MLSRDQFTELGKKFSTKLAAIKVCAFDVDGILTDGRVFWQGDEVGWNRSTHTRDGYGLKFLMEAGIKVGIITGGNSLSVEKRFKENLGLDFVFMGDEDKRKAFLKLEAMGFASHEILYMGDELFDIPLMKRAGFSATVPEASPEVHEAADYITKARPGMGCVREVIDILRYSRNIIPHVPDFGD
jgi:3-deoxy-D-manno-octulosonate 8-phosphate phosphatase (KDO 8-P phosphatase)